LQVPKWQVFLALAAIGGLKIFNLKTLTFHLLEAPHWLGVNVEQVA
jgi:hypothetical protein